MVAPAVIGAVGSILGGLFGRTKAISAGDNAFSHVQGIMRASSTFGFNPLTLLGAVSPMGGTPADNSSFGQGIANAAMIASDAIGARQNSLAGRSERLNQTQARLQKRLNAITIRAPVPGVYGRVRLPSDPQVYGDAVSAQSLPGAASIVPLPQRSGPSGTPDAAVTPVDTTYVTSNGEEIRVPEGVDLEDVATGFFMNIGGKIKRQFIPWASSIPAVRREYTAMTRAAVLPKFSPPLVSDPTKSRMPTKTPWWMMPPDFIEKSRKARPMYEWPSRPGYQSLRWQ